MDRPTGIPFWVITGLSESTPRVIQILAESFEDDWYVAPGQVTELCGKISERKLFKTRESAIATALDSLKGQKNLLEQQIHYLKGELKRG